MFEYISAFDFTYEVVKKLELNLNIEFGRAVLSTSSVIPSCPLIPSRLKKKLHIEAGQNRPFPLFIPSRFSYKKSLNCAELKSFLKKDFATGEAN